MASSTKMPTTSVIANNDIRLRLKPSRYMTMNVETSDSGMAMETIMEFRTLHKNSSIVKATRMIAITRSIITELEASNVNSALSAAIIKSNPEASYSDSKASSIPRVVSDISTVLASVERCTVIPIDGIPFIRLRVSISLLPSCTSATSFTFTAVRSGIYFNITFSISARLLYFPCKRICVCLLSLLIFPVGKSRLELINTLLMSRMESPYAAILSSLIFTCISRSFPPISVTCATPGILSKAGFISWSMRS
ncbi:hypothetical protein JCM10512_5103 [Bacteroides reticulotermitis JCM 10512]|uniref:Uncharacterized protein n=1 Tax=Bacteroides reticulotermitis JCM 10512 TaxID=1445607 RepID=W4V1A7_9BACE|nr:hypothetical protein JCM10512_5103 [Bacteroides reticulotermitis JCM 10512]